jgi:hypothetical protein
MGGAALLKQPEVRYKVAVISQAVASDASVSWTAYTPRRHPRRYLQLCCI